MFIWHIVLALYFYVSEVSQRFAQTTGRYRCFSVRCKVRRGSEKQATLNPSDDSAIDLNIACMEERTGLGTPVEAHILEDKRLGGTSPCSLLACSEHTAVNPGHQKHQCLLWQH